MKKVLRSSLIIVLLSTLLIACSSQGGNSNPSNNGKSNTGGNNNSQTEASGEQTGYPLQTDQKLTYWGEITGNLVGVKPTHQDVPFFQEWQKKTGVQLEFIAPPSGQGREAMNVLLASGDLPDLIEYNFLGDFPGGPERAIKEATSCD